MMTRLSRFHRITILCGLLGFASTGQIPGHAFEPLKPPEAGDAVLRDYLSANGLLNRGLYELAEAEYRKFLSEHADHEKAPVARYGLAVSLFRLKKYDDAAAELQTLSKQEKFEYAAEVGAMLGQCLLIEKKYPRAVETFDAVVKQFDKHDLSDDAAAGAAEAAYHAGNLKDVTARSKSFTERWPKSELRERVEFFGCLAMVGLNDYPSAASGLTDHLERYPKGPFADQAALLLAQCRHRTGAIEQAAMQYAAVVRNKASKYVDEALYGLGLLLQQQNKPKESGEALDRLLKEFPESTRQADARLLRGRAFFDEGKFDRAASAFRQAIKAGGEQEAEATYWLAKCRLRRGEFAEAADALAEAIDKFPNHPLQPEMQYDRAVALLRAEKTDTAVQALEAYRQQFPRHAMAPDALQLLAATYHRRQDFDKSLDLCNAFLECCRNHALAPDVAFLSAENDFLAGCFEPAVAGYRRYLKDFGDKPDAIKAKFRMGLALSRLGKHKEAEPLLAEAASRNDETFASARAVQGDVAFEAGNWKEAETHFAAFLTTTEGRSHPDDAMIKLGLAILRQERFDDAIAVFDRIIEQHADSAHKLQAMFERAQALVALNRNDDAAKAFEAVLDQGKDSRFAPHALNHLGQLAMRAKDFDKAAKYFDQLGRDGTSDAVAGDALFQRGQALMAANEFAEASKAFAKFAKDQPDHPNAPRARAQGAIALARLDKHQDAIAAIDRVLKEPAEALEPATRVGLKYERAWCLRQLGKNDEAAAALKDLTKDAQGSSYGAHVLVELADLEMAAKRFESAAALLRQMPESSTSGDLRQQADYRLGVCEFELGHFDEAVAKLDAYLKSSNESPQTASALFFCGEALFKAGKQKKALERFEKLTDAYTSDPVYGPALLRMGECNAALQLWPASEKLFARYLERFADGEQWYQAQFGMAWAQENQARQDDAIAGYRKVVDRHKGPTAARAQFQIGECLFARKKYDEAVRELLKVDILYAYPEWSAAALFEAGRCFEALGKLVEARTQYKTVVDKYKDTEWARTAAQRLKAVEKDATPARAG